MSEINSRIKELIIRFLREENTPAEMRELEDWAAGSEENQQLFLLLSDHERLKESLQEFHEDRQIIWDMIGLQLEQERSQPAKQPLFPEQGQHPALAQPSLLPVAPDTEMDSLLIPAHRRTLKRTWLYAAASVALLILGGIYYRHQSASHPVPGNRTANQTVDIAPGGNKATLQLADGSMIRLDSADNGRLTRQGASDIVKLANGELVYQAVAQNAPFNSGNRPAPSGQPSSANKETTGGSAASTQPLTGGNEELAWNTLRTPRAGQYQLVLPDGTRVWLNNASSLRYPIAFSGKERIVELTGEAFFAVAPANSSAGHAHLPFKVRVTPAPGANPVDVEVLGTQFNVMAYPDEAGIRTTLLEGKVRVSGSGGRQSMLKPGEQVIIEGNRDWVLNKDVNMDEITDWKNGFFHFNDADLPTVMRQLARWYDVTVRYEGTLAPQHYQGSIKRDLTLAQVLENLGGRDIHFSIEGKTVIVTP